MQVVRPQANFGSDDDPRPCANLTHHTAEVLLRRAIAVLCCRIEVRDACIQSPRHGPTLLIAVATHHQAAYRATPETECGNRQTGRTERSLLHVYLDPILVST